eukprot:Platyproteum_vivax@DN5672_c0_g1_i1.p1
MDNQEVGADVLECVDANADLPPISQCWIDKYEAKQVMYWNKFYKTNQANFFKDRHWIDLEFLLKDRQASSQETGDGVSHKPLLIELGCGVGNTLMPFLEENKHFRGLGVDCSSKAIELLQTRIEASDLGGRVSLDVVDLIADQWGIRKETGDVVTLIYVLSTLSPASMPGVVKKAVELLVPGGQILVRDYARYDLAQVRFAKQTNCKLDDNFYVRQDGTRAYYFTTEELGKLFEECGLAAIQNEYKFSTKVNRKTGCQMKRIWIQGQFQKPHKCL